MTLDLPLKCDWGFRPSAWAKALVLPNSSSFKSGYLISKALRLFHDCPNNSVSIAQYTTNLSSSAFGLHVVTNKFNGSYVSFTLNLPSAAVVCLSNKHTFLVGLNMTSTNPLKVFIRISMESKLGIKKNVHMVTLSEGTSEWTESFDLTSLDIDEGLVEKAWLDIIFENPPTSKILLNDLTVYRRCRAMI